MTKYNLNEFKEWLETKEKSELFHEYYETVPNFWEALLEAKDIYHQGFLFKFSNPEFIETNKWSPYREAILEWKAQVDQQERERESRGGKR